MPQDSTLTDALTATRLATIRAYDEGHAQGVQSCRDELAHMALEVEQAEQRAARFLDHVARAEARVTELEETVRRLVEDGR